MYGVAFVTLPSLIQDRQTIERSTDFVFLLCASSALYYTGKSLSSLLNSCGFRKSLLIGVVLSCAVLILYGISSSVIAILSSRLLLGSCSGYLSLYYEVSRSNIVHRLSWLIAVGSAALVTGTLYVSPRHMQLIHSTPDFFLHTPIFYGAVSISAFILLVFCLIVLLEKCGVDISDDSSSPGYTQVILI
jgi:hypothetical protein